MIRTKFLNCSRILENFHSKKLLISQCRGLSQSPEYSIEEIVIPNGRSYSIGCKVWKSSQKNKKEVPIVCVHGYLDNASSFDTLIPKLMRPGRTFYCYDLPGHGLSSHIENSHYNNHVESHLSIHRVVRHLKFDKFSLLGHSMGAENCVMYAATFPEGIQKLITLDGVNPKWPDWVSSVKIFVQSMFEIEATMEKPQRGMKYEELLKRIIKARDGVVTDEGCRILLERGAKKLIEGSEEDSYIFTHDVRLKAYPGMAMMTTEQMSEFCAALQTPTCVIKAGRPDWFSDLASKDFQTAMENGLKENPKMNVEFHTVDGTHHVHLNDPDKVSHIINKFLEL